LLWGHRLVRVLGKRLSGFAGSPENFPRKAAELGQRLAEKVDIVLVDRVELPALDLAAHTREHFLRLRYEVNSGAGTQEFGDKCALRCEEVVFLLNRGERVQLPFRGNLNIGWWGRHLHDKHGEKFFFFFFWLKDFN
jgi:hypothetical protein